MRILVDLVASAVRLAAPKGGDLRFGFGWFGWFGWFGGIGKERLDELRIKPRRAKGHCALPALEMYQTWVIRGVRTRAGL